MSEKHEGARDPKAYTWPRRRFQRFPYCHRVHHGETYICLWGFSWRFQMRRLLIVFAPLYWFLRLIHGDF